jgi:hypothetical protein
VKFVPIFDVSIWKTYQNSLSYEVHQINDPESMSVIVDATIQELSDAMDHD